MTKELKLARVHFMTSRGIESLKVKLGLVIEMKGVMSVNILVFDYVQCKLNTKILSFQIRLNMSSS